MIKHILALSALFVFAQHASALTIDFEDVQAGTIVDDEYAALGITFGAINLDNGLDLAVVFDTNHPTGGDHDLGAPFMPGPGNTLGSIDPGNVLILQENSDSCDANTCTDPDDEGSRPAGQFIIEFDTAITLQSIDFFDVETLESDATDANRITLFDSNGDEIQLDFFTPDTGGDNQWIRTMFGVENVSRIVIAMGGSGAIDNIQYAVPLPAGLPLILSALAGLGLMRRR